MERVPRAYMGRPRRTPWSPGRPWSVARPASSLQSPLLCRWLIALQVLAQERPAAMDAALARFAGDAQAIGRLGDRELLHVAQQDHFAVDVRERLQRANDVDPQIRLWNL